jgi:serine/threonine protein kinase
MSSTEIGYGGYGAVFRPPLGSNDSSQVGKVIFNDDNKDIKREWFNTKAIKEIAEQNYFLYPVKKEEINVSEYNKYAKSPFEGTRQRKLTQFTLIDGGISLRKYKYQSFKQMLVHMLQISRSIQIMLQNNIVHLDLHLGNVMYNGAGSCKVIDFGLSKTSKTFYSHLNVLWSCDYAVNPPEFRLMQSKKKHTHNLVAEKELLAKYVSADISYLEYIYMNPVFIQSFNELNTSIVSLADNGRPTKKVTLEYLKTLNSHETTDVYGLGVAMIEILTKTDNPDVSLDVYVKVWEIITKMIMPHPKHRISIATVINEITLLVQQMEYNN